MTPAQGAEYVASCSMQPMVDPYKEAKLRKSMVASNTKDCFRAVIGRTIKGVLFDAMPPNRHDLKQGNKTLVFEDGSGLTISSGGSYWLESKEAIDTACRLKAKELADLQRETADVLNAAGWGGTHIDGDVCGKIRRSWMEAEADGPSCSLPKGHEGPHHRDGSESE